ncbi:hypothetical protein PENTCL1PPCAC_1347 [Pristionchus entomophagus]|uniref:Uncharacterized protein n=1 Tax=Pristionchus entomophagus TaxID=358040 RepID=A0AAV5SA34_9BILA|nr:hypothetical protein PENTCL1PPCAC_1347 [Pristionchus entomophagus]
MCLPKKKKGKPIVAPVKAASVRAQSSANKDASRKKISSAPAKGPDKPVVPPGEAFTETSAKEKTCLTDKSDLMQISLYKTTKKKEEGSGPPVTKPADREQDSPEVFENNAQVESLNPVNVTQIFVDSVIPQTNVSKQHTDIIDQNTLENVDPHMEDMIFDPLDSGQEQYPEVPQPRPRANVLQPEDDTLEFTHSERHSRPSEKGRGSPSAARTEHRPPTTPDRLPSVFTPPPPTKSEKVFHTGKRAPRGPLSTRTRPSGGGQTPQQHVDDNTCPSHEPLTQRTHRPAQHSTADYRNSTIQTAIPEPPPQDNTCGSREPMDSTATAKKTPNCEKNNLYTAQMSVTPEHPRDT